jgi:hypothetical protein
LGRIPIIYEFSHTTGMDYIQWPVSLGIGLLSIVCHFVFVKPIHLVMMLIEKIIEKIIKVKRKLSGTHGDDEIELISMEAPKGGDDTDKEL